MSETKNCQDCYKFDLLCTGTAKLTALDDCFKSKAEAPRPQDSLGSAEFDLLGAIERLERDMADGGTMVQACEAYAHQYGGSTAALVCLIKMREAIAKIKAATGL